MKHKSKKICKTSFTSKSTIVVSWLPTPLDQNWATANSIVLPPSTAKEKVWADGEENVITFSDFKYLFKGESCKTLNKK